MAVPYPLSIRTILHASKSRSQPASFTLAQPRRGYAYAQAIGTDVPVFWDVQFRFTTEEALIFQLWFTQLLQGGLLEFEIPIRTEFGLLTHVCRFLPDDLMPAAQTADIWQYSAKIMARRQLFPDGYADAADLIVGLPDWQQWAEYLDIAVNQELPVN